MGYKSVYPYGVLPIDSNDWFANHVVLCKVDDAGVYPITGFKSITKGTVDKVGQDFSFYSHLIGDNSANVIESSKLWVKEVSEAGETAYQGGWTMCPELTADKVVRRMALEVSQALMPLYYGEYKIPNMIFAVNSKFKVNKLAEPLGFKYLRQHGIKLPACEWSGHADALYYIMHIENYGYLDYATQLRDKYKTLWDRRLTF